MSKTLKILSRPKKNAEEYGKWAVNAYIGCSHGCLYCYLKKGPSGAYLGQNKPVLKKGVVNEEHAYHLAMAEIIEHRDEIIRDGGLFMTFTSDPCAEETRDLFFHIANESMHHRVPVTLLTKATGFFSPTMRGFADKYRSLPDDAQKVHYGDSVHAFLKWLSDDALSPIYMKSHIAFGWTLTGYDELEPNAPSNADRIVTMKEMADYGMKTWASIEPVIDFPFSLDMIAKAVDAGCRHFKIGLMTKCTKVCRRGFTLGGKTFEPYDPAQCLAFVQDVMQATRDRATVYWKQSFRDFIGGTSKHRLFSNDELHKIFDDYPNAVGKDWTMFK